MLQSTSEKRAERHGGKRAGAGRKDGGRWQYLISVVRVDLSLIAAPESSKMVTAVISDRRAADPSFYEGEKVSTLVRNFFRYRNKPVRQPAQVEAAIPTVEKWGKLARPPLARGEAQTLVSELYAAAGLHGQRWRQTSFGKVFEICARKYGLVDHEKIKWLRWCINKFNDPDDPTWFPRERPEIRDRHRRDRVLDIVRGASDHRADIAHLMRRTKWTRDAVVNLTRRLCGDGELVRIAPGVFTLPGLGTAHVPARERIVAWFDAQPSNFEAKTIEIAAALDLPRQAVDSALHGHGALVRDGLIKAVRRGVFARGGGAIGGRGHSRTQSR